MMKLMAAQFWIYRSSKPPGFHNIELRVELLFWFSCNTAMMEDWFSKINIMKTSLGSCVYPKHSAGQGTDVKKWLRCTLYNPCGYFLLNLWGRSSKQCIFTQFRKYLIPANITSSQYIFSCISNQMHAINSSTISAFYMIVCDPNFDYDLWVFLQYEVIDCIVLYLEQ